MRELEQRILAAAMDRILPGGAHPGAREANAVGYAEWLIRQPSFEPAARPFADGLALLEQCAIAQWGISFPDCDEARRDAVLTEIATSTRHAERHFFGMLVKMTLAGVFCLPEYGGNRDGVGWRSIGFAPHPLPGAPGHHAPAG